MFFSFKLISAKSFSLFGSLCVFGIVSAQALSPLSSEEMEAFRQTHRKLIADVLSPSAHEAYRTVAVARQLLGSNPFNETQKSAAHGFYLNVIFSALQGISFGGINPHKKASAEEYGCAQESLLVMGLNMDSAGARDIFNPPLGDMIRPEIVTHYKTCQIIFGMGLKASNFEGKTLVRKEFSVPPSRIEIFLAERILNPKPNFEGHDWLKRSYKTAYDLALEAQVKAEESKGYRGAVGTREELRERGKPSSASSPSSPLPVTPPKKEDAPEKSIFPKSWNGALFRSRESLEVALARGLREPVCQFTGQVRVDISGSGFYNGTGTLIGPGIAITNAHIVHGKASISGVSMNFPGSRSPIAFDKIFIHPRYNREAGNDNDVALLVCSALYGTEDGQDYFGLYLDAFNPGTMIGARGYVISHAAANFVNSLTRSVQEHDRPARTLSIQTLHGLNGAGKMETPWLVDPRSTHEIKPVLFPEDERSLIYAAYSSGCSGSPLIIKIEGTFYIWGMLESQSYSKEILEKRSNIFAPLSLSRDWIIRVLAGREKPTFRFS